MPESSVPEPKLVTPPPNWFVNAVLNDAWHKVNKSTISCTAVDVSSSPAS